MKTHTYKGWSDFSKKFLVKFGELSSQRKRQLVFRGQADAQWPLRTSLDRVRTFGSAAEREGCLTGLVRQFQRQVRRLYPDLSLEGELAWELLGRHHGLPTSVLDFSRSPYVSAYFAFAEPIPKGATAASIWVLDLEAFDRDPVPQIAIVDEDDQIRFNPREQQQFGLFVKVKDVAPVEELLKDHLERHDIPTGDKERATVLSALNDMMITAGHLFRDMDGAARTAAINVLVFGES
jgi:hypothetical protein